MFEEDIDNKPKKLPLDLDVLSIEELEERIINLKTEISLCEAKIKSKKSSLEAANALFGKKS